MFLITSLQLNTSMTILVGMERHYPFAFKIQFEMYPIRIKICKLFL